MYIDPNGSGLPSTTNPRIGSCGGINPSAWCDNSQNFSLGDISTIVVESFVSSAFVFGPTLLDQCGVAEVPFVQNFLVRFARLKNWRRSRRFLGVMISLMWCSYIVWFAFGFIDPLAFMEAGAIDKST